MSKLINKITLGLMALLLLGSLGACSNNSEKVVEDEVGRYVPFGGESSFNFLDTKTGRMYSYDYDKHKMRFVDIKDAKELSKYD
jgi:hypothetical protein